MKHRLVEVFTLMCVCVFRNVYTYAIASVYFSFRPSSLKDYVCERIYALTCMFWNVLRTVHASVSPDNETILCLL